ncbi:hypothetical protein PZ897_07325 [Hoeflea sp. YIM 152468]|uniref:hypothetical protein n=1 Tax=Hoeflea sp. YIM 152468 TaxID=3031759 RepID=UPI0023DC4CAC|nr:hypothetical protein [Hoeflea sp. YIM 152468]MDF1607981.1 hypothetical protein [Hoeflea sp. YIM 152468]
MIEFVLLFALGFLAAALVALILAPIIHQRVVSLTERRIRASVPLSTAEIRAEKDMDRAAFAAKNARLSVDLRQNRDQLAASMAHGTRLSNELVAIRAEKIEAERLVEERDADIRDLRATVTARDAEITTLTGKFADATHLAQAREHEIAMRDDRINRIGAEIEELRIDVVTLDTEAENFKSQIRELRTERNMLRDALKDLETVNKDLEIRLDTAHDRLTHSEEMLAKTITALTDRENALDRRIAEVDRFKTKNRELSDELRSARKALSETGSRAKTPAGASNGTAAPVPPKPELPLTVDPAAPTEIEAKAAPETEPQDSSPAVPQASSPAPRQAPAPRATPQASRDTAVARSERTGNEDLSEDEKIDRLRARQAALIERLLKADKSSNDPALRRELASVAALMVELTASRDGANSPVYKILQGSEDGPQPGSAEPSLAMRARELLANST